MKRPLQISFFLASISFAGAVLADATDEAEVVFQSFFKSFTDANPAEIVSLFSSDALFWGTGSQTLVRSTQGIQSYFSGLSNLEPGERMATAADISILPLGNDQAMVSGTWQVAPRGQTEGTLLRVSAVVANRNGEWKIVQFHNSRIPE